MSKKAMLIIVLLALMFLGMTAEAKAAEVEDGAVAKYADVNEKLAEIGLPEFALYDSQYKYIVIQCDASLGDYMLILLQEDIEVGEELYVNSSGDIIFGGSRVYYTTSLVDNTYTDWSKNRTLMCRLSEVDPNCILYSDVNIYSDKNRTTLFFQLPLLPTPKILGMEAGILAAMIQPEIVLQEVTTLLPIVIPVMAGWTGLSKALQLLSRLLNQA